MRFPIAALVLLSGCHGKSVHIGSPQIQRAPEVTCIVVVQSDKVSAEMVKAAMDVCKGAQ